MINSVCGSTLLLWRCVTSLCDVTRASVLKSLIILVGCEDIPSLRVLFLINLDNIGGVEEGSAGAVVDGSFAMGGGGGLLSGRAGNRERLDVEVLLPV